MTTLQNEAPKRNYGIDLLKSLSMFFVIWFHFSDHGTVILKSTDPITFNWCILTISRIFGGICNCVFILSTGYLLCEKKFNFRRIVKLFLEVWFYSVLCGIVSFYIGTTPFNLKTLVKILMPFTFYEYWFFSEYIILILLSPLINIVIENLDEKKHKILVLIGFILIILLPTFYLFRWIKISSFLLLYCIGAFFKKYGFLISKRKSSILSSIWLLISISSIFVLHLIISKSQNQVKLPQFIFTTSYSNVVTFFINSMNDFPCFLLSVFLFITFAQMKVNKSKLLDFISPSLFSVYLIHIGRLSNWFFQVLFDNSKTYGSNKMFPQLLLCSVTIFIGGILFDKIRIFCFEKPVMKVFDLVYSKATAKK